MTPNESLNPSPLRFSTLNEQPLHRDLKQWYMQPGDRLECGVDGFTIDIVRGGLLIEIQTGSFASMRRKLQILLSANHHIRLVYPLPQTKYIIGLSPDGTSAVSRRKSPKKGNPLQVFAELVRITQVLKHPNLTLEILFTEEEEARRRGAERWRWRRRGWSVRERHLIRVLDTRTFATAEEIGSLLPPTLPDPFTTADIAVQCKVAQNLARQIAYTLHKIDCLNPVGKRGNTILYRRKMVPCNK